MSALRGGVEESRERKVALFLTLVNAFERQVALSQEEIFAELKIDDFSSKGKVPKKRLAYEGAFDAKRQKFERDKADIRDLGFQIDTVVNGDRTGYWIDQRTAYAPPLTLGEDEQRVVAVALRMLGFGSTGVSRLFDDEPVTTRGALVYSPAYTPILSALHDRRLIRFSYRSKSLKQRVLAPLHTYVEGNAVYVVGLVDGEQPIKGFRINRIESPVEILRETFFVADSVRDEARAWTPHYEKDVAPLEVKLTTSAGFAAMLPVDAARVDVRENKGDRVRVVISFDGVVAARYALLACGTRVSVTSPDIVIKDLIKWLKGVNRGSSWTEQDVTFPSAPTRTDTLAPTLQLISAVYQSPEGVLASTLAQRFSMSLELVKSIMSRLIALQLASDPTTYLVDIVPGDDTDDDVADPTYVRAASYESGVGSVVSPLLWRDLFEVNVALRHAALVDDDPALQSAIATIEQAIEQRSVVVGIDEPKFLTTIRVAITQNQRLTISYGADDDVEPTTRDIDPTQLQVVNGHFQVRAWCSLRQDWRNFRVDRILEVRATTPAPTPRPHDPVPNWASDVGDDGIAVVIVVPREQRWIFESLQNVRWAVLSDDELAVRVVVRSEQFLDRLMVQAGPGASVLTPAYAKAGRQLAKELISHLA